MEIMDQGNDQQWPPNLTIRDNQILGDSSRNYIAPPMKYDALQIKQKTLNQIKLLDLTTNLPKYTRERGILLQECN